MQSKFFKMNPFYKSKRYKNAFTLIELMVVIVVIGIVGGIIFSGASFLYEKQAIKQAKVEVEVLKIALDDFKREYGDYPETFENEGKLASFVLFHSLFGTHEVYQNTWEKLDASEFKKSLLPTDKMTLEILDDEKSVKSNYKEFDHFLADPWGEPYIYQYPRMDGHSGFLLYSKGPDQKSEPFSDNASLLAEKRPEDNDNIPSSEPGNW